MATPVLQVNQIIKEVMEKEGINPREVPDEDDIKDPIDPQEIRSNSQRYFIARGFGHYRQHLGCPVQHHNWHSYYSWSVIDLKEQRFHYHYSQACHKTDIVGEVTVKPTYDDTEIEKMAKWACDMYIYLVRTGKRERPTHSSGGRRGSNKRNKKHNKHGCELCRQLNGKKCYTL